MSGGWLGLDWGTVPAWVSCASIFIAAVAYRRSVRDKEQDQASSVFSWAGQPDVKGDTNRQIRIANRSAAPIYSITITPYGGKSISTKEIQPGVTQKFTVPAVDATKLAKRYMVGTEIVSLLQVVVGAETIANEPLPVLIFQDAGGRWWRRDGRGNLRRARRRGPIDVTLELYLAGYNLCTTAYNGTTKKLKVSRGRKVSPMGAGFIGRVIYSLTKEVQLTLQKRSARRKFAEPEPSSDNAHSSDPVKET